MNKKLIHLLEDDIDINEVVTYILTEEGYEVNSSTTVAGFKEMISQKLPDIAILDIMLPDGDGIEVCRNLSGDEHTSDINIIMISANRSKNDLQALGCSAEFIAKPFSIDHFITRVKHYA